MTEGDQPPVGILLCTDKDHALVEYALAGTKNVLFVSQYQVAAVDALAETDGGETGQTTLNLLVSSVHPARAGLQVALVDVLLDAGAQVDRPAGDGAPLLTALAFHYADAAAALARRGARIDTISAAAGLGREADVRRLVDAAGPHGAGAHGTDAARALILAAALGHADVVAFLLDRGVRIDVTDAQGFTALHWAAARGHARLTATLRGGPTAVCAPGRCC